MRKGNVGAPGKTRTRPTTTDPVLEVVRHLAKSVREGRARCGLTQAQLAQQAGVTVETVARLERVLNGPRASANENPSLKTLVALSRALGVSVGDLLP